MYFYSYKSPISSSIFRVFHNFDIVDVFDLPNIYHLPHDCFFSYHISFSLAVHKDTKNCLINGIFLKNNYRSCLMISFNYTCLGSCIINTWSPGEIVHEPPLAEQDVWENMSSRMLYILAQHFWDWLHDLQEDDEFLDSVSMEFPVLNCTTSTAYV